MANSYLCIKGSVVSSFTSEQLKSAVVGFVSHIIFFCDNLSLIRRDKMIYQFGVLFLVGTYMSITSAQPHSCACTLEYAPICGTDGVTYPNKCSFECDRGEATMAYRGECRPKRESPLITSLPPCSCTREAMPVCGTDGHTYSNPCMLNCAKQVILDLKLDYVGHCVTEKREIAPQKLPSCACTRNFQPVCASDGVTYSNECLMKCAGADLIVEKDGSCDTY